MIFKYGDGKKGKSFHCDHNGHVDRMGSCFPTYFCFYWELGR